MGKSRIEAFSDGVIAIIITIMVLELRAPEGEEIAALEPLFYIFLSYVMSFVYIGIYWTNHHHLLHAVTHIRGSALWANLHLLFWLSLTPFATAWMGENHFTKYPVALYGLVLLLSAIAYYIFAHVLIAHHGRDSVIATALGGDFKGKISPVLYIAGIVLALLDHPQIACGIYAFVAIMWLIPDPRIERQLAR